MLRLLRDEPIFVPDKEEPANKGHPSGLIAVIARKFAVKRDWINSDAVARESFQNFTIPR